MSIMGRKYKYLVIVFLIWIILISGCKKVEQDDSQQLCPECVCECDTKVVSVDDANLLVNLTNRLINLTNMCTNNDLKPIRYFEEE